MAMRPGNARRFSSPTVFGSAATLSHVMHGELHGMPQERDYLERAAEAYREALESLFRHQGFF